jgi:exopolyphosphatase/guanosine-5'-triphosphate,3'-diphosphate pyrophosphatase
MPFRPSREASRCAVVDLGSNSVRLVVFEGERRNPMAIFNEKAVVRLGRGLEATGRLDAQSMAQALTVMHRYDVIVRAMGADPFEVLATSAVRDAANGGEFVDTLREIMPGVAIRILSGAEEAAFSADGVLCGIPSADGILADIGGGSLELVQLDAGKAGIGVTLPIGVIRLAERSCGDFVRARAVAEAALAEVPWLGDRAGGDLYLVGGAWRALARIHMAQTSYPLSMVHHYAISREEARDLTGVIAGAGPRALERLASMSRRRVEDLPFAAIALRRLLRASAPRRVIFSANGMREGWFMRRLPEAERMRDPLLEAARELAGHWARDPTLPPGLMEWTAPLFQREHPEATRLREATCWMSDVGSHEHPEFRAEQSFLRVLYQPGVGLDHHARAFLALAVAQRYEAEPDTGFLAPARMLLDVGSAARAEVLGVALRLAYTLSAGTPDLLAATSLRIEGNRLVLKLAASTGVFAGESILRRLDRLALALGLEAVAEG